MISLVEVLSLLLDLYQTWATSERSSRWSAHRALALTSWAVVLVASPDYHQCSKSLAVQPVITAASRLLMLFNFELTWTIL